MFEDDPAALRFICRKPEANKLAAVVPKDGASDLQIFQTRRADLVMLDIGIYHLPNTIF